MLGDGEKADNQRQRPEQKNVGGPGPFDRHMWRERVQYYGKLPVLGISEPEI